MQISNYVNSNISEVRKQTTNQETKQDKQTTTPSPLYQKKQNEKKPLRLVNNTPIVVI